MHKNILTVIGITILFLGTCITPSVAIDNFKKSSIPISNGYIQGLIDNASDGDTIYIPSGTYYENVVIDKSISLVGEDKDLTIIDGGGKSSVIKVIANGTHVSGFTIQNSSSGDDKGGIISFSNYNKFFANNIINNKGNGICLNQKSANMEEVESSHNSIYLNTIENNGYAGITIIGDYWVWDVKFRYNKIYNNIVSNNGKCGIAVGMLGCCNNIIYKNQINSNNNRGILVCGSYNFIIGNNIENHNEYGIELVMCFGTLIKKNNFIDNDCNAFFSSSFLCRWVRNYWDDRIGFGPKIIEGVIFIPEFPEGGEYYPWRNFDWYPAKEPYDI